MSSLTRIFFDDKTRHQKGIHYNEIDIIKAVAITAVILLHSIPREILFKILSPFHIWHAVPIFMMIAGMTSALKAGDGTEFNIRHHYSISSIKNYLQRIIVPFTIIWLFEIAILVATDKGFQDNVAFTYVSGGFGSGSYFTPLYIQHLIVFPAILWMKHKFRVYNQAVTLFFFFILSLLLEWLCIITDVPAWLYRLLYVRYVFAAVVGSYLIGKTFRKPLVVILAALSFIYILSVAYLNVDFPVIYPAWTFQHAPAYFYTLLLIVVLTLSYPLFKKIEKILIPIGKASYHIFLFQMLYFWQFARFTKVLVPIPPVYVFTNALICLFFGYQFYNLQVDRLK